MKESIYNLLNDIDSSPESYTTAQVIQKDIKDWKKAFKNKEQNSGLPGKRALRKHRYVKRRIHPFCQDHRLCRSKICHL